MLVCTCVGQVPLVSDAAGPFILGHPLIFNEAREVSVIAEFSGGRFSKCCKGPVRDLFAGAIKSSGHVR